MEPLVFEWDERKNSKNFEKHGIAFEVATNIFNDRIVVYESPQNNEMRYVAVGIVDGRIIAVVFTERHEKIRIISARHAWKKEKIAYSAIHGRYASRAH